MQKAQHSTEPACLAQPARIAEQSRVAEPSNLADWCLAELDMS